MPSIREGLGLSGIEMLASGLPVVASDVHGIVDYIKDGQDGYLCNPLNENEFAEAINKLVPSSVRNSMKKDCVALSKAFDKKNSYEKMKKIYELLVD